MEQERKLIPIMIKSYTDLEQSKKLAEFLPIESADMFWLIIGDTPRIHVLTDSISNYSHWNTCVAWSLSALLNIYPMVVGRDMDMYCCWQNHKNLHSRHYNNPIDACVEMIIKLHELNLL